MATQRVTTLLGLNTFVNPFDLKEGELIRAVNIDPFPFGAIKKRAGYGTLNASIGGTITSLWDWHTNNGTTFWLYACSGGTVYYSTQGTGAWTVCGNGTMTNGARIGHVDVQGTLQMIGDGTAATRHTTNGTSFTNTSSAPVATQFEHYQNRVHALGTLAIHWATAGTPTDWTTDSSSINLPGAGAPLAMFKAADRIIATKTMGDMFRWDGYNLFDLATKQGPSSPYAIGDIEDYKVYPNRDGFFGFSGDRPQIVSNSIQRQIYNDANEGIVGGTFSQAPATAHRYEYLCAVGTVTDDFTDETINNCIDVYNYQFNQWRNYQYYNAPTAFHSYQDNNRQKQLIFGDATGQVYQVQGTTLSDNGQASEAIIEFVIHGGIPEIEKKWNALWFFFHPGNLAKVQVATANTFTKGQKKWVDCPSMKDGIVEYRPPAGTQSRLFFVKIYESSRASRFLFYGFAYDATPLSRY